MTNENPGFGHMVAAIVRHGVSVPWDLGQLCEFYHSHEKSIHYLLEWYAGQQGKSEIECLVDFASHSDSDRLSDLPYILALFVHREWSSYLLHIYR